MKNYIKASNYSYYNRNYPINPYNIFNFVIILIIFINKYQLGILLLSSLYPIHNVATLLLILKFYIYFNFKKVTRDCICLYQSTYSKIRNIQ